MSREESEEPLVTSKVVTAELGIPHTTLYRLVKAGVVPAHPQPRQPWHRRAPHLRFHVSEVRAALDRLRGEREGAQTS